MKITVEIHGQILEGELDDESVDLSVRQNVERIANGEHRMLEGGTFSLTGKYTARPMWRD